MASVFFKAARSGLRIDSRAAERSVAGLLARATEANAFVARSSAAGWRSATKPANRERRAGSLGIRRSHGVGKTRAADPTAVPRNGKAGANLPDRAHFRA